MIILIIQIVSLWLNLLFFHTVLYKEEGKNGRKLKSRKEGIF